MSKVETFTAPETIETISLSDLYLSDLNPRQEVTEEGIALLADSLVMCGLIQNLSGLRDADGKVAIVAGGRRLRALNIAVTERADLAQVPVKVTDNPFVAEQWANVENTAREELDPVDEVRAYGKMAEKSLSVAKISNAFGVTEAHVRRRLALAGLPVAVLDALKAGEISMGLAKAMTVSTEEEKILEVLEQAKGCRWFSEHDVKHALTSEAVSSTNRKAMFVGQEAYVEAGGTVTADLFADETLFNESALLDRLFAEKLAAEAAKLREAEGWDWVETHDESYIPYGFSGSEGMHRLDMVSRDFTEEQAERYDELAELYEGEALDAEGEKELAALEDYAAPFYSDDQRNLSGVFLYVGNTGEIKTSSAYVAAEDVQAAIEAGVLAPVKEPEAKEKPKPAYSQKFIDDMVAIRLAAVQTALLDKPDYVLSLFAFSATPASGLTSNLFGFGYGGAERNTPEIDDQFILDPRLGGKRDAEAEAAYDQFHEMAAQGSVEAFKAFRDLGKKTRNGEITAYLARRFLTQRPEFMAEIEGEIGADMRAIWTPSAENCFKRLKGWQLDDLYKDLLDLHGDTDMFKAFVKSKKGAKNEVMHKLFNDKEYQDALGVTEVQKARIDTWVPDCF